MSMSAFQGTADLASTYRGTAYPIPTQIKLHLYTAAPTDAGGGTEVPTLNGAAAPTGYEPKVVNIDGATHPFWAAVVDEGNGDQYTTTSQDFEFGEFLALDAPVTITHWATKDQLGNVRDYGAFAAPQTFSNGGVPRVKAGQVQIKRR